MTYEDYFHELRLLLAANRVIYLNIAVGVSKTHGPRSPHVP